MVIIMCIYNIGLLIQDGNTSLSTGNQEKQNTEQIEQEKTEIC